jgi:MFS family permease
MSGVRRNLSFDLIAGIGIGVTTSLIGALLPSIARQTGLPPIGLAALAAAPFLANLLGAFAGRVGPRSLRGLAGVRALGAILLVGLAIVPLPWPIVIAVGLFWLSLSLGAPLHFRVWGSIYPPHLRGRLVGLIWTSRAAAAGLAAIVLGVIADAHGAPAALAIGGVVGGASALAIMGVRTDLGAERVGYSARHAIRLLTREPLYRRLALAQGFYGGGLIAAAPLFALVHVDRLGLSLTDVGSVAVVGAMATMLAFLGWGMVVDRWGGRIALGVGSSLGLVSLVGYALAPGLPVLWLAAAASGVAGAAIELGIQALISDRTPISDRAATMAGWNALNGARGIFAPIVSSVLVQARVLDVTTALLVCAAVSLVGVGVYAGLSVERRIHLPRAWRRRGFRRAPARAQGPVPDLASRTS